MTASGFWEYTTRSILTLLAVVSKNLWGVDQEALLLLLIPIFPLRTTTEPVSRAQTYCHSSHCTLNYLKKVSRFTNNSDSELFPTWDSKVYFCLHNKYVAQCFWEAFKGKIIHWACKATKGISFLSLEAQAAFALAVLALLIWIWLLPRLNNAASHAKMDCYEPTTKAVLKRKLFNLGKRA